MQEKIQNYNSEGNGSLFQPNSLLGASKDSLGLQCTIPPSELILSKDDKFLLNVWGNVMFIEIIITLTNYFIQ